MSSTTRSVALAALAALAAAAPAQARTAPGQVFAPNPVADLGIQTLTDQKDTDYFTPFYPQAYHRVTLTDLDGSGTLTGDVREGPQRDRQGGAGHRRRVRLHRATRTSSSRRWPTTG